MLCERETENKNYFAGTKNVVAKVKCSLEGLKHRVGGGFLKIIEQGGPVVHRGPGSPWSGRIPRAGRPLSPCAPTTDAHEPESPRATREATTMRSPNSKPE